MSLAVSAKKIAHVTVVKADGEMDYHNFRTLKSAVETALGAGERSIVLDLSEISYLDSSALGSLLYSQKRVHERGGQICVIASKPLMDILTLTHLDSHFNIVESIEVGREQFVADRGAPVVPLRAKSDEKNRGAKSN